MANIASSTRVNPLSRIQAPIQSSWCTSVPGLPFATMTGMAPTVGWKEIARRTWKDSGEDDIFGLAAALAYYFFLALFPAILFLIAVASFFPLSNLTDDLGRSLGPFVSPLIIQLIQDQMQRIADTDSGGLLTIGAAGALWSTSAAMVSIVGALDRASD